MELRCIPCRVAQKHAGVPAQGLRWYPYGRVGGEFVVSGAIRSTQLAPLFYAIPYQRFIYLWGLSKIREKKLRKTPRHLG